MGESCAALDEPVVEWEVGLVAGSMLAQAFLNCSACCFPASFLRVDSQSQEASQQVSEQEGCSLQTVRGLPDELHDVVTALLNVLLEDASKLALVVLLLFVELLLPVSPRRRLPGTPRTKISIDEVT